MGWTKKPNGCSWIFHARLCSPWLRFTQQILQKAQRPQRLGSRVRWRCGSWATVTRSDAPAGSCCAKASCATSASIRGLTASSSAPWGQNMWHQQTGTQGIDGVCMELMPYPLLITICVFTQGDCGTKRASGHRLLLGQTGGDAIQ